MNACIVLCLALTAFLANAVAQYETCVADTAIVTGGTPGVTVSIGRDEANEMVQITLVGPPDVWFGQAFDGLGMANNYGFIISDSGVSERRFASGYEAPTELATTSIVSSSIDATNDSTTVVIERPYSATDAFDFTPIFGTCAESTIEAIASIGQSPGFTSEHVSVGFGTLTSTCACTMFSTTEEDATTTEEAATTYETCVSDAEIVTGVSVSIGRDEENEMVQITLVGPSDTWFAGGFDGLVMANNYGFIISDSAVSERRFAAEYTPPTELATTSIVGTPETSIVGGDRTVVIERPYSATDAFDFAPILGTCEESTIEAIAAIGDSASFTTAHVVKGGETLTSTCTCTEPEDSGDNAAFVCVYVAALISMVFGLQM
uniref:DOMON domain-containing protein n=1 Tax=Elphidium margaritaceum TaxID=933848 RepID=A0A7S0TCU9_9EUKA|mmetsp:Transcript_2092/g.4055  ORF Transcript_2092/g.4055 Transcript_2092/m.4055 type:complete len:377 (+) Transcript_2092:118-1248(+)